MPTPQDRIVDQLESDVERLKMEIFELRGVNKLLKKQLQEATEELEMEKETAPRKYVSRDDQMLPGV